MIKYIKRFLKMFKKEKFPIEIEIKYNGAYAICKVNGKYFNDCDSFTKAEVICALRSVILDNYRRTESYKR